MYKRQPVANLDAVQLSGTIVKRASLHNADIIEGLDLHIGDMVYVEKGGEIIPKITGVDKDCLLYTSLRLCNHACLFVKFISVNKIQM